MTEKEIKELKTELKGEIKSELNGVWHRHPIVLMLAGLLITIFLGGLINFWISGREEKRQSDLAIQEERTKRKIAIEEEHFHQKIALRDSITVEIERYLRGLNKMAIAYWREADEGRFNTIVDKANTTRSRWAVVRKLYLHKLETFYESPNPGQTFDSIIALTTSQSKLNKTLLSLSKLEYAELRDSTGKVYPEIELLCAGVLTGRNDIEVLSDRLQVLMRAEIQAYFKNWKTSN